MARPKKRGRDLDGVILLDKPQGISSNDILQRVKRLYQANKAGHTGALDPLATGMLPICFGEATKFSQFLLDADKSYRVKAKLGERTDTSDAEGQIVERKEVTVSLDDILQSLPHFRGELQQVPTMFSALKHEGRPLYEYARAGISIERPARPITIFSLELIEYQVPYLTLDVRCSKGTYIRTLIDDLGEFLGCGAHVVALRRTSVANYPLAQMVSWEQLQQLAEQQAFDKLEQYLLPIDSAVANLPVLTLTAHQGQLISFGQRIKVDNVMVMQGLVRLNLYDGRFLGVAKIDHNEVIHPHRLVNTAQILGEFDDK
ncbi:tRNA pseudouridine(55) synthase TruB [Mergibacter septicus]|uniref:tRNA pseudouridine(55) synthase TruB n=1 Tax=Mergibacter septicus TaxID=221402 RepID=UPI00117905A7|nr:tRNA pseudouridine(55) synthase TruB [Mergibacter septicus]AWX13297.1 tRNA pseudouridine(55) synthase TruB [Mergibacter septicus]